MSKTKAKGNWTKAKRESLLEALGTLYPNPESELNFKNDYELLIAVMLSAQCTDKKVNEVTPSLFRNYRNFKQLSEASTSKVESIIRQVNYYKTKSKNIIATAERICSDFRGRLPQNSQDLMKLPGVGQKTANVILSEKGFAPALPVDTHVFRLSRRLGLSTGKTPEKVEDSLKEQFEPTHWRMLHHSLILHGRAICKAARPMCEKCSLGELCPSKNVV